MRTTGDHPLVSGHVFIAYHPNDIGYRDRLATRLEAAGMDVWSEPPSAYGTNWLIKVRPKIDSCGVFVVLMTQRAEASDWIDSQVARALEAGVPIRPLLLQGQWTFKRLHIAALRSGGPLQTASQLFTRVTDGDLPRQPYIDDLRALLHLPPAISPATTPTPTLAPALRIALPPSRIDTTNWSPAELDLVAPMADLATWSPDGSTIAIGGDDGMTYLWDVTTGLVRTTIAQNARIRVLNWSPDNRSLVTGDELGVVRVWDVAGAERFRLQDSTNPVVMASWSADGAILATASGGGATVRLWHGDTGQELTVLGGRKGRHFAGGAWSPVDPHLLAIHGGGRAELWHTPTRTVRAHLRPVRGLAWTPDGTKLATTIAEEIAIWDVETAQEQRALIDRGNSPRGLAWSPDGQRIAVGGTDATIRIWDPDVPHPVLALRGHPRAVFSVSWSPDGRRLVTAGKDRTPLIWELSAA